VAAGADLAHGLDPQGIRALRELLRSRANNGHTVFLSSHLLAEVDELVNAIQSALPDSIAATWPLSKSSGSEVEYAGTTSTRAPAWSNALGKKSRATETRGIKMFNPRNDSSPPTKDTRAA